MKIKQLIILCFAHTENLLHLTYKLSAKSARHCDVE